MPGSLPIRESDEEYVMGTESTHLPQIPVDQGVGELENREDQQES